MPWDWYTSLKSFKGNAIHDRLENYLYRFMGKNPEGGYLIEKRLWDRILDRKISGKFDVFLKGTLYDWKTCSAWKRLFESYEDWITRLNLYAYFLRTWGVQVDRICIIAWYMDWDKFKAKDKGYPNTEVEGIHLDELWDPEEQERFMMHRITEQIDAENVPDDDLPYCTDKEMWVKGEKWAVKHPKSKNACRVVDTEAEAKQWIVDYSSRVTQKYTTKEMTVEHRPGSRGRCEDFCKANVFCNQYREWKRG